MEKTKTNFQGNFTLFVYHGTNAKGDFNTYSIRISKKLQDGGYLGGYVHVQFTEHSGLKDWNPRKDKYNIDIKTSWPTPVKTRDGGVELILTIHECKVYDIEDKK